MRQWTVDAFAAEAFKGNPACVVEPMDAWPATPWMQRLAQENNQAETAFILRTATPGTFRLRWFTPTTEVPLCGHATLAAAHVLVTELGLDVPRMVFATQSGELSVICNGGSYDMDFPADPPHSISEPEGLTRAIGAQPIEVWAAAYLVAVLENEEAVRAVRPDLNAVKAISIGATGGRGDLIVVATAEANRPYDVVSRFFAPGAGVPEDPATGSAHCILAPLYCARLKQARLRFHQAYPGRGGNINAEHRGDRVVLSGDAVTVMESRLKV